MTKPNECYAYFSVVDNDLDPYGITRELEVAPTEAWCKGELGPGSRERRFGRWTLRSRVPDTEDLEAHVRDVLLQMDARADSFLTVSRRYGGVMQLVGYFHEVGVGLHFPKEMLARLTHYELEVDFDAYYLYSDGRECTE